MKNQFVNYTQALALKHLGFNEICLTYYFPDGFFMDAAEEDDTRYPGDDRFYKHINNENENISAPLKQQCFQFFRDKFKLIAFIEPANGTKIKSLFGFYICDDEQNIINDEHSYTKESTLHFKTYEKAEEEAINKLIQICEKHLLQK